MNMRAPATLNMYQTMMPAALCFLMAIIMLVPIGTGAANMIMPHLALISLFYWTSNLPNLIPYGAAAFLGFFLDLWLDVPIGLNMLLLVLTRAFVINQMRHYMGRPRVIFWGVFSLLSMVLYGLSWVIVSILSGAFLPLQPVAIQWLVTALAYAPIAFIMGRLRRAVM